MRLTPDILRAAYDFLRATPPFKGWRLPPGEEVEFIVSRTYDCISGHRHYLRQPRKHIIDISEVRVAHTFTLLRAMAHEMVHAVQAQDGAARAHNEDFCRRTARVCQTHGFDPKEF